MKKQKTNKQTKQSNKTTKQNKHKTNTKQINKTNTKQTQNKQKQNKKIMAFGTFDILHLGHIHYLTKAKKLGGVLIVIIARDENVKKIKGKYPIHNEKERQKIIASLKIVDKAILGDLTDFTKKIKREKPEVIAVGYDQPKTNKELEEEIKKINLKIQIKRINSKNPERHKGEKIKNRITETHTIK